MGALGRLAGAPSRRRAERGGCVDCDPGLDTGQLCTRVGQVSARQRRAERVAVWRGGPDGHSCCDAPVIVSKRRRPSIVAMCTSWIVKPETRAMGAQWMMGGECVER